jgi:DNA-binding transcriptional LysR family regulator
MDLRSDRLAVLVAVVDTGGFAKAASRLGMTQSSVSQSVAALERDVGEPLFARVGRQAGLTEAGRVLAEHARQVLAGLGAAREALWALRDVVSGTLRLGTSDTFATYLLPAVFTEFRASYPDVELKLDNRPSPAIAAKVAARELDVGLVSLPLPGALVPAAQSLTQVPLVRQRDVVIAPRRHRLAGRPRLKPEELAAFPLLLLDGTTGLRAWLDRHFARAGLEPQVVMETSSVEVLKRLVERGFGVSVIPELALDERDRLCAIPLVGVEPQRWVGLVLPPGPSRAARAFGELARRRLRRPRDSG